MNPTGDLDEAKQSLRRDATARRRDAAAGDDGSAGRLLAETVAGGIALGGGAAVSGYWPIASEIDVMPLLRALAANGHDIALPVVTAADRPLVFRAWRDGDAMAEGPFGIREPLAGAARIEPRIVLTPLLAFDREGYRLGYGGGFYDRSLAGLRQARPTLAIGIAWAAQEVPAVPHDGRDQPLDWVATEREAIRVPGGAA